VSILNIPVDARRQDWPRLVANAINYLLRRDAETSSILSQQTGWANYQDTAGAQTLAASTQAMFTNNAGAIIQSQKPSDVTAFWDSNKITGRTGDAIMVKVQMVCTPSDASASMLNVQVDIGGTIGVLEEHDFPLTAGSGVAHPISFTFLAFTMATWEANGATINVTCDGGASLTAKRIVVARMHKAR